jgi:hypothetical protein
LALYGTIQNGLLVQAPSSIAITTNSNSSTPTTPLEVSTSILDLIS